MVDGVEVAIPRRQVQGVLVILALNPDVAVPRDVIVDGLWEARLPDNPNHAVHVYVNRLRALHPAIGSAVETVQMGYRLDGGQVELDTARFAQLAETARPLVESDPAAALDLLDEALGLWRGPAFGPFGYAEFVSARRRWLDEERLTALENRCDAVIRIGAARRVVPRLRELVAQNPYRERFVQLLMTALHADGRRTEALHAYRVHRQFTLKELGVEPSPALQTLVATGAN
jgi:DNA-binding SARP family transcriptional activator